MFIELGLPEDIKLCLFIYGGQPPGQWELKADALPEGWICVVCSGGKPILSDKQLPSNFRLASPDEFIPDLVRPELCLRCLATFAARHVSACTSMAANFANSYLPLPSPLPLPLPSPLPLLSPLPLPEGGPDCSHCQYTHCNVLLTIISSLHRSSADEYTWIYLVCWGHVDQLSGSTLTWCMSM